ncbi:MAG: hypothetical protein OEW85_11345 [Acidimicrobiia bacterium]|nr:hypothetical protein [Acidimicrobiia bacterium]
MAAQISFDDEHFERASRGLVATHATGRIQRPSGNAVWDVADHDVVRDQTEPPDTVMGRTTIADAMGEGPMTLDGDLDALLAIFANLDTFSRGFDIVTP